MKVVPFFPLVLLLASCAGPRQTPRWTVYLPFVSNERPPKKGVGLYAGDCRLLEMLDVEWYYSGERNCPGVEFVEYITHPGASGKAATRYVMFYNEPRYQPEAAFEQMVTLMVEYAANHPDAVLVGPCPADDLEIIPRFWAAFAEKAGHAMPPERIRMCVHCYLGADACMERVESAAELGAEMGIDGVWLPEFGRPLGLDMTIRQQVDEMRRLVSALEASPDVERYAYWPGLLKAGYDVPNGRYSSWQPLGYEFHDWNLSPIGVQLTDVGIMYAEE